MGNAEQHNLCCLNLDEKNWEKSLDLASDYYTLRLKTIFQSKHDGSLGGFLSPTGAN